ncbi:MAG: sulfatase-like hydrolase/transferase, partial [Sneathiella sp.]
MKFVLSCGCILASLTTAGLAQEAPIAHDSEYYILEAQLADQWGQDNAAVDAQLAAFRETNGGKAPNILYILVDDIGFGDMGIPELNAVRGISTPNINHLSDQGMRMARMYTEPSCTPTRVAFSTGRLPVRMGMGDTAVDIS